MAKKLENNPIFIDLTKLSDSDPLPQKTTDPETVEHIRLLEAQFLRKLRMKQNKE